MAASSSCRFLRASSLSASSLLSLLPKIRSSGVRHAHTGLIIAIQRKFRFPPYKTNSRSILSQRMFSSDNSPRVVDYSTPANRLRLFQILNLSTFKQDEISQAYSRYREAEAGSELGILVRLIWPDISAGLELKQTDFEARVISLANKLDTQRMLPLILSYIGTGISIGVIIPVLPLMVKELSIPTSSFGMVVSVFGLARLLGNIPAAGAVESWGRKPTLVAGIGICGASLALVSLTLLPGFGIPWMVGCRFIAGLGVAAFGAAANMIISDISNPLNRTRTFAPVLTSFQLGTSLGPVAGGFIVASFGIMDTYLIVGSSIAGIALLNALFLKESKPIMKAADNLDVKSKSVFPPSRFGVSTTLDKWSSLLKTTPALRNMVTMNSVYWTALSGTQMVLLPLLLVSEPLSLAPTQLGLSFALMSVVNVAVSQPVAILADKYIGKVNSILLGTTIFSASALYLPMVTSVHELWMGLIVMAAGNTFLSAVPSALAADLSSTEDRAQAMALLRTSGDIGMLTGSICAGALAEFTSISLSIQTNSALLLLATLWYGYRSRGMSSSASSSDTATKQ